MADRVALSAMRARPAVQLRGIEGGRDCVGALRQAFDRLMPWLSAPAVAQCLTARQAFHPAKTI
ncbi:MAG: hypothetical protein Kow0047_05190 [Anaerolineae bacterium]